MFMELGKRTKLKEGVGSDESSFDISSINVVGLIVH